jgi:hypothetical protein
VTLLPIVARELKVASRRRSTYWLRAAAALWALALGTWLFLVIRHEAAPDVAKALLGLLTGSTLLYALLSGVRSTADCLSEEKREGTLGLLFLTDLKGYDVVLGKLAANSLNVVYGILAVVPMMGIPMLLGGVTLGEFGRMALVILNTMLFSVAAGMLVSSLSRSSRKAVAATLLLVLGLSAGLPSLGVASAQYFNANRVHPAFLVTSPGFGYYLAWDFTFRASPQMYWWSLGVVHFLAWCFLAGASWIAPRSWQDDRRGTDFGRWSRLWTSWTFGSPAQRLAFRRKLLDHNPYFWLVARARLKPALVWFVLFLLAAAWACGLVKYGRDWLSTGLYVTTGLILNLLLKGWWAAETCRQVTEDRRTGALELLLTTPLSVTELLRGQLLALLRQFLAPGLVVLLLFLLILFVGLRELYSDQPFWVLLWLSAIILLAADAAALFWVGVWDSVNAKKPQHAATTSAARILAVPWLVVALTGLVLTLTMFVRGNSDVAGYFFLWVLLISSLVTDVAFGAWARHKLLSEFRDAAARRYLTRESIWARLFGSQPQNSPSRLAAANSSGLSRQPTPGIR